MAELMTGPGNNLCLLFNLYEQQQLTSVNKLAVLPNELYYFIYSSYLPQDLIIRVKGKLKFRYT